MYLSKLRLQKNIAKLLKLIKSSLWFFMALKKLIQIRLVPLAVEIIIPSCSPANLSIKNQLKLNQNDTRLSSLLSMAFYVQSSKSQSINNRESRVSCYIRFYVALYARLQLLVSFFSANWCMAIKSSSPLNRCHNAMPDLRSDPNYFRFVSPWSRN